jgi:hypothetical protein
VKQLFLAVRWFFVQQVLFCCTPRKAELVQITYHFRAAQVAYQDLLRLQLEAAASELMGSVEEGRRCRRVYL